MTSKTIIMSYTTPPDMDDIQGIAESAVDHFPRPLSNDTERLKIEIGDFASDAVLSDLDIEDEYELLSYYTGGTDAPSGEKPILYLYRMPILDAWCETGEDLTALLTHIVITEVASAHGYSDAEIDSFLNEMVSHDLSLAS